MLGVFRRAETGLAVGRLEVIVVYGYVAEEINAPAVVGFDRDVSLVVEI